MNYVAGTVGISISLLFLYLQGVIPVTVERRLTNTLFLLGPIVTFVITPWFNLDPINLGKCLALTSLAFSLTGLLIPYLKDIVHLIGKKLFVVCFLFGIFLLLPLILTDAPISQQIFGQFGRNTGILTYLSLLLVLLLSAIPTSTSHYKKIPFSLISTQGLMTLYCLLQLFKKDPIRWSAFYTFGTLGNVNFLSGFMGIAVVVSLILAFQRNYHPRTRIFLIGLSILDIYIVTTTDSIQGLVALAVGFSVYILILCWKQGKLLFSLSLGFFAAALFALVMALLDKGPLKTLIYQQTIVFRADYMHAGLKMLLHHPLTGVGIDSYDDWYKAERGVISAFRTGLNRTSNTAHNVMLDIGSGGGFPLLICYLSLIGFVALAILRGLRGNLKFDASFIALSCAWIAYQVQASVSINQIGVGIWGWLISGSILGYVRTSSNILESDTSQHKKLRNIKKISRNAKVPNTPPANATLFSVLGLLLGFVFAFLPFKADMDYRTASNLGRLESIMKISENFATNSFLVSQGIEVALKNGYQAQARTLDDKLISKFPRNLYGWQVRFGMPGTTEPDRVMALRKIRELDPYLSICADPNPTTKIKSLLLSLPAKKQYELARGWTLLPPGSAFAPDFHLDSLDQSALGTKLSSFCRL